MQAFFINLDSRPDRRLRMEQHLAGHGIVAERLRATTPADLPDELIARAADRLSAGELACTASHLAAWRLLLARDLPHALVLEDDCVLAPQAAAVLADPGLLRPDVELVQLETHPSAAILGRGRATAAAGVTRHRLMSSSLGTCAYIISADAARFGLSRPELEQIEMGVFLFGRDGPYLYRHRVFQLFPAVATPLDTRAGPTENDSARSDLSADRRPRQPGPRRSRLRRNLDHLGRALGAFELADIVSARHRRIPFAGDVLA